MANNSDIGRTFSAVVIFLHSDPFSRKEYLARGPDSHTRPSGAVFVGRLGDDSNALPRFANVLVFLSLTGGLSWSQNRRPPCRHPLQFSKGPAIGRLQESSILSPHTTPDNASITTYVIYFKGRSLLVLSNFHIAESRLLPLLQDSELWQRGPSLRGTDARTEGFWATTACICRRRKAR